jgi:hypothetical protein
VVTSLSCAIQVNPPSSDLSNTIPSGPAHDTYISPLGPNAGTAPSTVLSSSMQSPEIVFNRNGVLHVCHWFNDLENKIREVSKGAVLP